MFSLLEAGSAITQNSGQILEFVQGNWGMLAVGIALIIIAVLAVVLLKQILINSIIGVAIWAIAIYVLQIKLNFWLSLIVSIIFGIGGIGVLLVLKFFGIPV
jgi:hypothetical protein